MASSSLQKWKRELEEAHISQMPQHLITFAHGLLARTSHMAPTQATKKTSKYRQNAVSL